MAFERPSPEDDSVHSAITVRPHLLPSFSGLSRGNVRAGIFGKLAVAVECHVEVHGDFASHKTR
jgi:hypothetical protein